MQIISLGARTLLPDTYVFREIILLAKVSAGYLLTNYDASGYGIS